MKTLYTHKYTPSPITLKHTLTHSTSRAYSIATSRSRFTSKLNLLLPDLPLALALAFTEQPFPLAESFLLVLVLLRLASSSSTMLVSPDERVERVRAIARLGLPVDRVDLVLVLEGGAGRVVAGDVALLLVAEGVEHFRRRCGGGGSSGGGGGGMFGSVAAVAACGPARCLSLSDTLGWGD